MSDPTTTADDAVAAPRREIHHGDALQWLAARGVVGGASFITSLPDVCEVPLLGMDGWRAFFDAAATAVLHATPSDGVSIFFQSDIRHEGLQVDKGYLVMRAAEREGVPLLFHKIVCRRPPGSITFGRAAFSHLLAFSRGVRPPVAHATADVLPELGEMTWSRAMGVAACEAACRFILRETQTRTVVDPFCGHGTALAVANALGLHAIGVDASRRQCRKATRLTVELGRGRP